MSMINDALRRASHAAQSGSAAPPPLPPAGVLPVPPLPQSHPFPDLPTFEEPMDPPKNRWLVILLVLLLLGGVGGGAFYWHQLRQKENGATTALASDASARKDSSIAAGTAASKLEPGNAGTSPVPQKTVPTAATPAPAATTRHSTRSSAAPAGNAAPAEVRFPPLRLQSIYYRPSSPSVMINGRTLYVNDEIQGVTVAAIESSSVTLVLSGRTNILTLR